MLNILSLQALRKRSTGPSKVAKNLIKGLDLIGERYVINGDIRKYKNIYILDDENSFLHLDKFDDDCDILVGPIINKKKDISSRFTEKYTFLYPSQRFKAIGDKYHWHKKGVIWPVGIDTYKYSPSKEEKNMVLIYFKTRFKRELDTCINTMKNNKIQYEIIDYDIGYKEKTFLDLLDRSKYVIWIGRQESQGIALEEILSKNIPILLRDVDRVGYWDPKTEYEKKSYAGGEREEKATSAEYFDERCGIRFWKKEELEKHIIYMENHYKEYTPRKYITDNLSLEKQAKSIISLYKNKNNYKKSKRRSFPYKLNFVIRLGFFFIDNKYLEGLSKNIIKFYNKANKIRQK